jgi:hypothetical protein
MPAIDSRAGFELVRKCFDGVRAADGVDSIAAPTLAGKDLLRA